MKGKQRTNSNKQYILKGLGSRFSWCLVCTVPSASRFATRLPNKTRPQSSSGERVRFRSEIAEYFHYECEALSSEDTPMQPNDRATTEVERLHELLGWLNRVDKFVAAQMLSASGAENGAEAAQTADISTPSPPRVAPSSPGQSLSLIHI